MKVQLTAMPERIAALRQDERGYPVPWFVQWIDDKPQFPIMDGNKRRRALTESICWICGDRLGAFKAFIVGPMCGINRTSAEPPSHLDCATFATMNCPFLVNPAMKRIENELTDQCDSPGGVMLRRNPGVALLWVTKSFRLFRDPDGALLIKMGEPHDIQIWQHGKRIFTIGELEESIRTGLPALEALAHEDGDMACRALERETMEFLDMMKRYLYGGKTK